MRSARACASSDSRRPTIVFSCVSRRAVSSALACASAVELRHVAAPQPVLARQQPAERERHRGGERADDAPARQAAPRPLRLGLGVRYRRATRWRRPGAGVVGVRLGERFQREVVELALVDADRRLAQAWSSFRREVLPAA